ncbi:MAG: mannose-1-phosphate guanylyltransferase/mannose-6-phosphate isomerase [Hyphomicrobiales bacterium]|nr:mannose-1-phosphate guanylyltransferase/mannose-6-phosphate isomerase [Hyphomicrobiales bacterium]MDE2016072.1 mannose-1-phosphate guanylyltransferase/mannose-6-phosphate isomerase [Hyphomicrobiales bacterium]
MANRKLTPVVLCGGSGTRLWPVSRASMPKQFIGLLGERSTFQRTLATFADPALYEDTIVVTNHDYRFTARDQIEAIGARARIVLEPVGRDSAAAVAVATVVALAADPEAIVGVFAADHVIGDAAEFARTCARAVEAAAGGRIVTIGIAPSAPATSYGYIRPGAPVPGVEGARKVERFVEKPDAATAAKYLLDGYLWNSGNFIFDGATMRAELERLAPDVIGPATEAVEGAVSDLGFTVLDDAAFKRARKISIDYAVMEKTDKAAVVPGAFGWSDIGGWSAVWDLSDKDSEGNAVVGRGFVVDGRDNYLRAEEGVVGVIGLDGIAVISTRDAVLVVPKDKADKVKELVERVRASGAAEAGEHREIHRPWGKYLSVDVGDRHQVKRITVKPAGVLSLQKHFHRAEHWVVVKGTAEVTRGAETIVVHETESIYLPIGIVHRMANPGKIPLEIVEVQVGSYLGEDDIVRLEDAYSRT